MIPLIHLPDWPKHAVRTLASVVSPEQPIVSDACAVRPFPEQQCFAIMRDSYGSSLISNLSQPIRPPAISRLIVTIAIIAVQCHAFGAWPHIFNELRRGVQPLGAHRNSAATVMGIVFIVRVIASQSCIIPRFRFFCSRQAICEHSRTRHLSLETSTASSVSLGKIPGSRDVFTPMLIPASTDTLPSTIATVCNDGKASKSLPSEIFARFVKFDNFVFSHVRVPPFVVRAVTSLAAPWRSAYFSI